MQPSENTVTGESGYLFDLSVNHYFKFVTEDGKLDEAAILEAGYNERQVPMIEAVLVKAGKIADPVVQPVPAQPAPVEAAVPATKDSAED
jgi:hypothetical protein